MYRYFITILSNSSLMLLRNHIADEDLINNSLIIPFNFRIRSVYVCKYSKLVLRRMQRRHPPDWMIRRQSCQHSSSTERQLGSDVAAAQGGCALPL
jgi:hypothetical protein